MHPRDICPCLGVDHDLGVLPGGVDQVVGVLPIGVGQVVGVLPGGVDQVVSVLPGVFDLLYSQSPFERRSPLNLRPGGMWICELEIIGVMCRK